MIKSDLQIDIVVGQNGIVWVKGNPDRMKIAVEAIRQIEREAHTSGLTDRVRDFINVKLAELNGEKT